MQANLEWIQREWRKWVKTDRAKKISASGNYKLGTEHVAKLFAAHCLEALHTEVESVNSLVDEARAATPTESTPPKSKMIDQALAFIRGEGLQGSILRESNTATVSRLELLLDRAQEQLQHNRHKHDDSREGRDRCLKCQIRERLARAATKAETCPTFDTPQPCPQCLAGLCELHEIMRDRLQTDQLLRTIAADISEGFENLTTEQVLSIYQSFTAALGHSPAPAPQKEKL